MLRTGMFLGDRYEILEKIGSGGMSDVYKARCHKLNRNVAIKVLKQEFSEDKSFVAKFKVEAQSAAGLAHPNIVSVFDVGEDNGLNYIVMELIEGITLKKYIERKGRLSVKETLSIAVQVAQGIEAAHNNHIIHRDIKPQNIIISREGKVKVTDFGIARAASANTINSNAMGSVHYISPEQARGGYIDEKSDIYSLGITMYEMVTGHVPFEGDTTVAIALQHIQEELPSIADEVPETPISVQKIIMKCTQKKPDARYLKVSSLIADLKHALVAPDEDFVLMNPAAVTNSRTVVINKRELEQIKSASKNGSASLDDLDVLNLDDEDEDEKDAEDKDDDADFDEDDEDSEDDDDDDEDDEDDEDDDIDAVNPKMDKVVNVVSIIVAVVIVVALIFGGVRVCNLISGGDDEDETTAASGLAEGQCYVPSVLGMTEEEAIEALEEEGLGYKITGYEYNSTYAKGQVCSQSVEADEIVDQGTTIELVISQGSQSVAIIDFTGYTREEIEAWCEENDITPIFTYEMNDEIDMDVVISWDPTAPAEVSSGDSISFVLSQGAEEVDEYDVPNFVGQTLVEAKLTAQQYGWTLSDTYEYSDTVSANVIISQDPSDGTLPTGSTIQVVVSLGAEPVTVPNVTGYSEADATDTLTAAGFVVNVATETSNTVESGLVSSQDPAAGSSVTKGSTVTIYISTGAATTTVPNVVGDAEEEAKADLENEGFSVTVVEEYSSTVEAGYVISQSPDGDTSAQIGSAVTITVSLGVETFTVPNVVGETQGAAVDAMKAAGVSYEIVEENSSTVTAGYVISQSVDGGTSVTAGETVTITVSSGPAASSAATYTGTVSLSYGDLSTTLTGGTVSISVTAGSTTETISGGTLSESWSVSQSVSFTSESALSSATVTVTVTGDDGTSETAYTGTITLS